MARDKSVRYHNRVARKYDAIYDDDYWRFHDDITWHVIKPHLPRDMSARVVDLGCGTGKWGLKLLKSGFHTTFLDHAPAMIGQVREKLDELGKTSKTETVVGDIVSMPELPDSTFALTLAMGDPLSICSDPERATREMFRLCAPNGIVIATADNLYAAMDHYLDRKSIDELGKFVRTRRTRWLTSDREEQFELTMFTPASLRKMFEKVGFEVLNVGGKPILPVRQHRELLADAETYRALLEIEKSLTNDESAAARASHLQIVARRRAEHS
ncbi:MAG TPA: methyltransferase domain-containing protein [Tepidisphaeraceae bacterium]|nr:methyltransferase domain-containing protein [Tepidisphaeraceae bacterium]